MVGNSNEAEIVINDVRVNALIDTGASVSTISDTFYRNYLSHLELHSLDDILQVECADGASLPYLGYIKAGVTVSGVTTDVATDCLFLVVPSSNYSSRVPILIGTNILQIFMLDCQASYGTQFLQKAALQVPWYLAFRCLTVREKELKRNKQALGVVRCAEIKRVTLPPNSAIVVAGSIHKEVPYNDTCAILQES